MIECQVNYAIEGMKYLVTSSQKYSTFDVKTLKFEAYVSYLTRRMKEKIWTSGCKSYYITSKGVVWALWPDDLTKYWWITRRFNPQDYNLK